MNKTNFTSTCGQWRYFDGLYDRILSICVVLRGNFACVFAPVVSPICSGGKLTRGGRIQRDELFDASEPFYAGASIYTRV